MQFTEGARLLSAGQSNDDDKSDKDTADDDGVRNRSADDYQCNICLDIAKEAVVSMCGHMFCWPCLLQWLEIRPDNQTCPVCKSGISKESVVPIYGRNSDHKDPREKHPPRPAGQRIEPSRSPIFSQMYGGLDGNYEQLLKREYRTKARAVHPDKGGSCEEMSRLTRFFALKRDLPEFRDDWPCCEDVSAIEFVQTDDNSFTHCCYCTGSFAVNSLNSLPLLVTCDNCSRTIRVCPPCSDQM